MEDTNPAAGDSNECPQRSCFARTVCSKYVQPMASANHDTPMTVDTSNGTFVYEEEVPAWDALGDVLKKSGLSTARCLLACNLYGSECSS